MRQQSALDWRRRTRVTGSIDFRNKCDGNVLLASGENGLTPREECLWSFDGVLRRQDRLTGSVFHVLALGQENMSDRFAIRLRTRYFSGFFGCVLNVWEGRAAPLIYGYQSYGWPTLASGRIYVSQLADDVAQKIARAFFKNWATKFVVRSLRYHWSVGERCHTGPPIIWRHNRAQRISLR